MVMNSKYFQYWILALKPKEPSLALNPNEGHLVGFRVCGTFSHV
jgi:hypothetical protein